MYLSHQIQQPIPNPNFHDFFDQLEQIIIFLIQQLIFFFINNNLVGKKFICTTGCWIP